MLRARTLLEKFNNRIFSAVHGNNIVYNTCWEDPALDREALKFNAEDKVLMITSAGCNALDYLLAGAGEVHTVDVNPIQNALLELKKTAILHLNYADFFSLFGEGKNCAAKAIYEKSLKPNLSSEARQYWDKNISLFYGKGWRKSFYYRGTSGLLAKLVLTHANVFQRLKKPIAELLEAKTIEQQCEVYESKIKARIWTPWMKWFLSRNMTLNLMGVPGPQKEQITHQYPGGVAKYIQDSIEAVITKLPFQNNYFYRVYIQGKYTKECCPEYLKESNFEILREKVKNLYINTNTLTGYMQSSDKKFSKFILLDHMDWMSSHNPEALAEEWSAILAKSAPNSKAIFRSAGIKVTYLDHLKVDFKGGKVELGTLLKYDEELAARLHPNDRVHTYASFYIAALPS